MALKSRDRWTADYLARIERVERKYGAAFEGDQARLRQLARGHKAKEHVTRKANIAARGVTPKSSADYAFVAKQRRRYVGETPNDIAPGGRLSKVVGYDEHNRAIRTIETRKDRFDRAKNAYLKLSERDREVLRKKQRKLERLYKSGGNTNEFYDLVKEMDDDIAPMYFYH